MLRRSSFFFAHLPDVFGAVFFMSLLSGGCGFFTSHYSWVRVICQGIHESKIFAMKNLVFVLSLLAITSSAALCQTIRQDKLYIDDGSGNFTVIRAAPGGGADTMPTGRGTVLVTAGTGASGEVLTSNGSSTPSWQTAVSGLPAGAVIIFMDNAIHSGFTYTGATLTSYSGNSWTAKASMGTARS